MDAQSEANSLSPSNPHSQNVQLNQIIQMITHITVSHTQNNLTFSEIQALRKATQNSDNQCAIVVKKGAIPILIDLLSSCDLAFVEEALYSLGNIACTQTKFRNAIISLNGINLLVQCLKRVSYSQKHLNLGLWAISNVCRGEQITLQVQQKMTPGVHLLCEAVIKQATFNEETLNDCLASIQYTLAQNKQGAQLLLSWGLIPCLFKFFNYENSRLKTYALKIIGNLTRLKDFEVTSELFVNGAIAQVYSQINCIHLYARKSVCWIFSQIASGAKSNVSKLFELPNFLQSMLNLFKNDDIRVKKELSIFFASLCSLGEPQAAFSLLKQTKIVTYYIDFLADLKTTQNIKAVEYILVGLETLGKILKFGKKNSQGSENELLMQLVNYNGRDILNDLMGVPCEAVQTKVMKIQGYFFKNFAAPSSGVGIK